MIIVFRDYLEMVKTDIVHFGNNLFKYGMMAEVKQIRIPFPDIDAFDSYGWKTITL